MSDHAPIQEETREVMNAIAKVIDDALNGAARPKRWGFALLVYEFGAPGRMNYIGNGKREDMLTALKELAARWEGRYAEAGAKQ